MTALPSFPGGYTLATTHLTLAAPSPADAPELFPCVSEASLTEFLAWEPHRSSEETHAMLTSLIDAQKAGGSFHWIARHGGEIIGLFSLIDVRRTHRRFVWDRAELAYWTAVPQQNKGYATEAGAAIIRFGFDALGLHRIVVYHAMDNPPSGRVAQKLGFRQVGIEREAFCKNGHWHDLGYYEMLATDNAAFADFSARRK